MTTISNSDLSKNYVLLHHFVQQVTFKYLLLLDAITERQNKSNRLARDLTTSNAIASGPKTCDTENETDCLTKETDQSLIYMAVPEIILGRGGEGVWAATFLLSVGWRG